MAKYELAMVVNAKIDDEKRFAVVKRAKAYIERFGATLGSTTEWGRKRLAYEIQKMHEGYFYFIRFEGPTTAPNELEQTMRIMDNVLRYLIVRIDDEAEIGDPNETDVTLPEETEEAPAEEAAEEAAEAAREAAEVVEEAAEEVKAAEEAVQE